MSTTNGHYNEKSAIMEALLVWVMQRPGFDLGNYDLAGYRADCRKVARHKADALKLLRFIELRESITGEMLKAAFARAFSGRLSWDGKQQQLSYCTGQYWPTEYRAAACAVLASAIWGWLGESCPDSVESRGDWIRTAAKREFGRGFVSRWFN